MSTWMSICFIYWYIFFDIVSRAPITTGMTTALTFKTFCSFIFKSCYFSKFPALWSLDTAKSIIWNSLFCCLIIEITKDFIFFIFIGWLWCVCVCMCVPLANSFQVILLTQQPMHVGSNVFMSFYILTFSQNWTCTHNVYYTLCLFCLFRLYIVEYCLSY